MFAAVILIQSAMIARAEITLKIGDARVPAGGEAEVPVLIAGSKTAGLLNLLVDYDPKLLEAVNGSPDEDPKGIRFGPVVTSGAVTEDLSEAGEWRISIRADQPVAQDGELLRLRFKAKGKSGQSCTLLLDAVQAWEKETHFAVQVNTQPGTVTITGGLPRWILLATLLAVVVIAGAVFVVVRPKKEAATSAPPPPQS